MTDLSNIATVTDSDQQVHHNSDFLATEGTRAQSHADRQRIFSHIEDAILRGAFGDAGRMPTERALAKQFNTSRNTIRKTLALLTERGLIERRVGSGTFVCSGVVGRPRDPENEYTLAELLEARLLFEPSIPELVVERATDDDISVMEAYLAELKSASTWVEFKEAKYCLHLAIVRAAHNRFISDIFEQVVASRRRSKWGQDSRQLKPVVSVRQAAYRDNVRIVEALKAGDADTACEAIRNYLLNTISATSGS